MLFCSSKEPSLCICIPVTWSSLGCLAVLIIPNMALKSSKVTSHLLLLVRKLERIKSVSKVEKMTGKLNRYENS